MVRAGQGLWILRQGILGHFRPLWSIFGANSLFKDTFPFEGRGCIPLLPPSRCASVKLLCLYPYTDAVSDIMLSFFYRSLSFLYPYGATLTVDKRSHAVISTGSVCFPINRPVCSFFSAKVRQQLSLNLSSVEILLSKNG